MRGIKESEALINSKERTILNEPTGPSINPAHPPSFIPFTELDAVSGAKLEMEQDHETPEQVLPSSLAEADVCDALHCWCRAGTHAAASCRTSGRVAPCWLYNSIRACVRRHTERWLMQGMQPACVPDSSPDGCLPCLSCVPACQWCIDKPQAACHQQELRVSKQRQQHLTCKLQQRRLRRHGSPITCHWRGVATTPLALDACSCVAPHQPPQLQEAGRSL